MKMFAALLFTLTVASVAQARVVRPPAHASEILSHDERTAPATALSRTRQRKKILQAQAEQLEMVEDLSRKLAEAEAELDEPFDDLASSVGPRMPRAVLGVCTATMELVAATLDALDAVPVPAQAAALRDPALTRQIGALDRDLQTRLARDATRVKQIKQALDAFTVSLPKPS